MVRRVDSASDDRIPGNTNWTGAYGDLNAVWGLPGSALRPPRREILSRICPAFCPAPRTSGHRAAPGLP